MVVLNILYCACRDWEPTPQTLSRSAYTPAQFENSLGKLHFSSVTAPRKIIDMDVVPNSDSQSTPQSQQKDSKKTRQLLLEIERVHNHYSNTYVINETNISLKDFLLSNLFFFSCIQYN